MPIVSISMSGKMLEEMDSSVEELGFAGRSDAMRAGLRLLVSEKKEIDNLHGKLKSILIVAHDKRSENGIMEIRHDFEELIGTHMHTSLENDKCMEIFILEGKAERIKAFLKRIRNNTRTEYVKLITP